jgi:hypothetical protein
MQYFTMVVVYRVKKREKTALFLLFIVSYVLLFQKLYVVLQLVFKLNFNIKI